MSASLNEPLRPELIARMLDDINQLAALSLTIDGFSRYREYRNWLVADGDGAEQIATVLTLYVLDLCECPPLAQMH